MAEIQAKVEKQLAMEIMGDQLMNSYIASFIVLIGQTNFLFYPIKIRLEMAEIWSKVSKQLATATLGNQRVASCMTSFIVIIKKTNFLLYPIKIRLEIPETCQKVAKQLATAILGDQLVASQRASWIVIIEQSYLPKFQTTRTFGLFRRNFSWPAGWLAGRLKLKIRLTSAQLGLAWLGLSLAKK